MSERTFDKTHLASKPSKILMGLIALLCLIFLIGTEFPRFLAYAPGVIGLAGLAALFFKDKSTMLWPVHLGLWMLGIAALMLISSFWSVDSTESLERAGKAALVLLGGFCLISFIKNIPDHALRGFTLWFPLALGLAGVILLINLYFVGAIYNLTHPDNPIMPHDDNVILSPLNRGVMTFLLATVAGFAVLKITRLDHGLLNGRVIGGVLVVMACLALFQTDSQSAQLAVLLAVIVYFSFPVKRRMAWAGLKILLVSLVLLAPLLAIFLFSTVAEILDQYSWFVEGYAAHRLEIWDYVSRRALESPFIGHGVEATRMITDFESAEMFQPGTTILHPHNFAIQIWIEFGALGALFTAAFFIWLLQQIKKMPAPVARFSLALFIACISAAATSYGLWQGWWLGLFTLLAAYMQIISRLYEVYEAQNQSDAPAPVKA